MSLTKCPACGSTISTQATQCPRCGHPMTGSSTFNNGWNNQQRTPIPVDDTPRTGLNILSFFFPVVGWVLYFVFKDNTPIKAKSCSKWAWIGVGISFAIGFIGGIASSM